jgi:hypothetical protein
MFALNRPQIEAEDVRGVVVSINNILVNFEYKVA